MQVSMFSMQATDMQGLTFNDAIAISYKKWPLIQAVGIAMNGICCLCQMDIESRDHIFFGCNYSRSIWEMILSLCEISRVIGSCSEELQWAIQNLKGKQWVSSLLRIAWKAYIYHVWKERNGRLYGNSTETSLQVLEHIKEVIRIKLARLRFPATAFNRRLCNRWGLLNVC